MSGSGLMFYQKCAQASHWVRLCALFGLWRQELLHTEGAHFSACSGTHTLLHAATALYRHYSKEEKGEGSKRCVGRSHSSRHAEIAQMGGLTVILA